MYTKTIQYVEALHKLNTVVTSEKNISNIQTGDCISAFHGTEIIAILFDKTIEEVMNDYLVISLKKK